MNILRQVDVPAEATVRHIQEATTSYINEKCVGCGTLYIAHNETVWIQENSGLGFSFEYPTVTVHAISRDRSSFSSDCLFAVLDISLEGNVDDGDNDYATSTELRFVPMDTSSLPTLFQAMSECQRLHPDQASSDEGEYNNDDVEEDDMELNDLPEADQVIFNRPADVHCEDTAELVNGVNNLSTNGHGDFPEDDSQFEDAD